MWLGCTGAEQDTLNLEAEGVKTQLCFTYKTQKRFAFNTCGISGDYLGENDAVFLINTFRKETESGGEGLLQIFEGQRPMSVEPAAITALNLKQISIFIHFIKTVKNKT